MLFMVLFEDIYAERPDLPPERARLMPDHLAFLERHAGTVVASGALRDAPDGPPLGGVWIVNAPDRAAVEALTREDPFWRAGLRRSVRVHHWAKAVWSAPFAACMETLDTAPSRPG